MNCVSLSKAPVRCRFIGVSALSIIKHYNGFCSGGGASEFFGCVSSVWWEN